MAGKVKVKLNPDLHRLGEHSDGEITIRAGEIVEVTQAEYERLAKHTQVFGGVRTVLPNGDPGWEPRTHQTVVLAEHDEQAATTSDNEVATEKGA